MAQYFEPSTDTNANFANSIAGQTNSFFLPSVYSKKVLNFFRKSSVVEAITNTDYAGEISAYGDSVKIIKEPVISVSAYTRNSDTTETRLTDAETSLVVDSANAFKFIVDDIETNMSHVNFKEVASSSAAYALKDAYDAARGCDCLLIITEWNEFKELDFLRLKKSMKYHSKIILYLINMLMKSPLCIVITNS